MEAKLSQGGGKIRRGGLAGLPRVRLSQASGDSPPGRGKVFVESPQTHPEIGIIKPLALALQVGAEVGQELIKIQVPIPVLVHVPPQPLQMISGEVRGELRHHALKRGLGDHTLRPPLPREALKHRLQRLPGLGDHIPELLEDIRRPLVRHAGRVGDADVQHGEAELGEGQGAVVVVVQVVEDLRSFLIGHFTLQLHAGQLPLVQSERAVLVDIERGKRLLHGGIAFPQHPPR
mmetsp:Transcript_83554/g.223472  ORF Transcript_83554/g.223472 Transcript_83554/m.223472 type:complete len:233 (-) Transcript_83554:1015-1713(-)